jgi:hypothetical protein
MAPIPMDANGHPDLPAAAFEQTALYRMEVALLVFYGDLLLITPALIGLHRGRLPIEISTQGAKFAEGSERWTELDEGAVMELETTTNDLVQGLAEANRNIDRLGEVAGRDSTQREVDDRARTERLGTPPLRRFQRFRLPEPSNSCSGDLRKPKS